MSRVMRPLAPSAIGKNHGGALIRHEHVPPQRIDAPSITIASRKPRSANQLIFKFS